MMPMGATEHYDLYVTNDASERFMDWRLGMNGPSDSNMTKIDAALFGKADKSTVLFSVLMADAWIGDSAPYTQRIELPEITMSTNGMIAVAQGASYEVRDEARRCALVVTGQGAGYIIVSADIDKPTIDIAVSMTIVN